MRELLKRYLIEKQNDYLQKWSLTGGDVVAYEKLSLGES